MLRRVRMRSRRSSSVPVRRRDVRTRLSGRFHGQRRRGTGPGSCHVRAAVSDITRADETREVLRRELERRERRVLTDGLRDDLIESCFVPDVHAFGLLGRNARQPHGRRGGVAARRRILRTVQSADHAEMIAKGLERLQNGREVKARTLTAWRPLRSRILPCGHVDHAKAAHGIRGRPGRGRQGRCHGLEQRQRRWWTPMPRRNVRRGSDILVTNIGAPSFSVRRWRYDGLRRRLHPHLERCAVDDPEHQGTRNGNSRGSHS